jgi:hypothetical protein
MIVMIPLIASIIPIKLITPIIVQTFYFPFLKKKAALEKAARCVSMTRTVILIPFHF